MATYLEHDSEDDRRFYDPLSYYRARSEKAEERIAELERMNKSWKERVVELESYYLDEKEAKFLRACVECAFDEGQAPTYDMSQDKRNELIKKLRVTEADHYFWRWLTGGEA